MFIKAFFTNSVGILTSRVLGFIRDLLTASILGANIYSDIFFVAFKLPNLFRRVFAEGAFTQAFLPSFIQAKNKGIFASKIVVTFSLFLLLLSFVVMIIAPLITKLIAFGFDDTMIQLATPLVRINFWYLLLIFLVTFASSLLHYKNHFATTAFATALLNIAMIVALILAYSKPPSTIVYFLSYGVIVGGFLQLLFHIFALKRYKMLPLLIGGAKRIKTLKLKRENRFYSLFFHSTIGTSSAQLSAFLDTWLASFLASGSISYLYYANRVFQLPLALFAIALSISLFPKITKSIKQKDSTKTDTFMNNGFWILAFLLSISTLGGIMLSHEIVWLLFERGQFTKIDTANTAHVLSMYLLGLIPFGLAKLFSLYLYASSQQKKAASISLVSLGTNVVFSLLLIAPFQASGLALASSLSGFILLFLTIKIYGLRKFLDIIINSKLLILFLVLIIEGIVLYFLKDYLHVYI